MPDDSSMRTVLVALGSGLAAIVPIGGASA